MAARYRSVAAAEVVVEAGEEGAGVGGEVGRVRRQDPCQAAHVVAAQGLHQEALVAGDLHQGPALAATVGQGVECEVALEQPVLVDAVAASDYAADVVVEKVDGFTAYINLRRSSYPSSRQKRKNYWSAIPAFLPLVLVEPEKVELGVDLEVELNCPAELMF